MVQPDPDPSHSSEETIQRTERNQDTSHPKVGSDIAGFPSKTIFPFRSRQNIDPGSDSIKLKRMVCYT